MKRASVLNQPWALEAGAMRELATVFSGDGKGRSVLERDRPRPSRSAKIAILPIAGMIDNHDSVILDVLGGTALDRLRAEFLDAENDPDVVGILLRVDSPGGSVQGVTEMAATIRNASKPVVAVADATMASAAYWLGASAGKVYVTPSGQVGSIGIIGLHLDQSKALELEGVTPTIISSGEYKSEGSNVAPLTDAARNELQRRSDEYYRTFVADVAKGRGVTADRVLSSFGKGRVVLARDALIAGMVDGIASYPEALARFADDLRAKAARTARTAPAPTRAMSDVQWLGSLQQAAAHARGTGGRA